MLKPFAVRAGHDDHDYRAVGVGDLRLGAIDGSLTRMPDTPANRQAYGSADTSDDSAPYPQLRDLLISGASTRATLGVVTGPCGGDSRPKPSRSCRIGRCTSACLFTPDRLWVMDRNFPRRGADQGNLGTGTHVLIRVKSDVPLNRTGAFLPDGSYPAQLSGGGVTLTVRVIEYLVAVAGQHTPELFCLVTDLLDHAAHPAGQPAASAAFI